MFKHLLTLIWNRKKQNTLLIVELVFSFFILFAVLSFVLHNLDRYTKPIGFQTENVWMSYMNLPQGIDSTATTETKEALLQEIGNLPEVEEVTFSNSVAPLSNSTWTSSTNNDGFIIEADMAMVGPNFGNTLNIPMSSGRWFSKEDLNGKYPPIIINKKMKDAYWPDSTVIGKKITWQGEKTIVGVMDNYKYRGEFDEESNMVLKYFNENSDQSPTLIMRLADGTSPDIEVKINQIIRQTAKNWPFFIQNLESLRQRRSRPYWIPIVALLSVCGFLIFNVSLGLFGVLVYNIKRRKSEIGLRRAIGASPSGISTQFILEILLLATISILISLFFAVQLPIMNVFEVETLVYVKAILFSAVIIYSLVLICTIYPSRQASLVHPATALHEE